MNGMDTVRVIEVVETTLTRRGDGTNDSPIRVVRQYWGKDGKLLAEHDPSPDSERERAVLLNAIALLGGTMELEKKAPRLVQQFLYFQHRRGCGSVGPSSGSAA